MYPALKKRVTRVSAPLVLLAAIVLIWQLGACSLLSTEPPIPPVEGTVMDGYTNLPLQDATVSDGAERELTSGEDGKFVISGTAEPITLTVSLNDYAPATAVLSPGQPKAIYLRPTILTGVVTDDYTGKPLAGAEITIEGGSTETAATQPAAAGVLTATTGENGSYSISNVPEDAKIRVKATDHTTIEQSVGERTELNLALRPDKLRVTVTDNEHKPLKNAIVALEGKIYRSGTDGTVIVRDFPEDLKLAAKAPGYKPVKVEVGKVLSTTIALEPFEARGLYMTANFAGSPDLFNGLLGIIDRTELNAVVIDVKDATGYILYDSNLPVVNSINGENILIQDLPGLLKTLKEHNVYTIARVTCFEDPVLADAKPELAVRSKASGGVWYDYNGLGWTNAFLPDVWQYNIDVAKEVAGMGFDEIQFDYVRFPSDGDLSDYDFGNHEYTEQNRRKAIKEFLHTAQEQLSPMGVALSADVFGLTMWAYDNDLGIGQKLEDITAEVDYVSPMVYPSHFYPGNLGYDNPADHPYEVVYQSMVEGAKMMGDSPALIRPWLQDFSLGTEYTPPMVKAQIQASEDFRTSGWLLWNAGNYYTESILRPQS